MEMLRHDFMQYAFQASILIAVIAPILGLFLVLRRQSLMADTLSHVSLVGVALGLLINVNPTIMTLVVVVIAALIIEYMRSLYSTYSEVSIAILMSAGLSLALILMSLKPGGMGQNVQQYLFGSIVTITAGQVRVLFVLFLAVLILFTFFRRPMYVVTFDEDTAHTAGLPVKLISLAFNVITGVTIAVIMPIAGALLVSAIMVLPAAISMRLSKSFSLVMVIGVIIGLIGMLGGLTVSYEWGTPPGATITMIFVLFFVVSGIVLTLSKKIMKMRRDAKSV